MTFAQLVFSDRPAAAAHNAARAAYRGRVGVTVGRGAGSSSTGDDAVAGRLIGGGDDEADAAIKIGADQVQPAAWHRLSGELAGAARGDARPAMLDRVERVKA